MNHKAIFIKFAGILIEKKQIMPAKEKLKVLYVSQEIKPYLAPSEVASTSRNLAQKMNEQGKEIRFFMPRFGVINERRHQLHEVIRLCGMNLIIDDMDHPLIIKVASIQPARMQVYFIDNEEYFKRKATFADAAGNLLKDNDERSMFFVKGVLETVKKLGWSPDIIHCHGWFTGLMPLYIKKLYNEDPYFSDTKLVYSGYNNPYEGTLNPKIIDKLIFDGFKKEDIALLENPTAENIHKIAIEYSDGVVQGSEALNDALQAAIKDIEKPFLGYHDQDSLPEAMHAFYDQVMETKSILA
ncbi:MAG: glycogen/starch synthase [Luteibaculaceae bacterium]